MPSNNFLFEGLRHANIRDEQSIDVSRRLSDFFIESLDPITAEAERANVTAPAVTETRNTIDPAAIMQQAMQQVLATGQGMYGNTESLTPEQRARMAELSERERRLQPSAMFAPGTLGSDNRGNPFGVDTRSLNTGLANFAISLANRERNRRLTGAVTPELNELRGQQAQVQAEQEQLQAFVQEMFPRVFGAQRDSELIEQRAARGEEADSRNHDRNLERDRIQAEQSESLARLNAKLKNNPNSVENRIAVWSEIRDMARAAVPEYTTLAEDRRRLSNILRDHMRNKPNSFDVSGTEKWKSEKRELEAQLEQTTADFHEASQRLRGYMQYHRMGDIDVLTNIESQIDKSLEDGSEEATEWFGIPYRPGLTSPTPQAQRREPIDFDDLFN